jgi:cytidylate kinase
VAYTTKKQTDGVPQAALSLFLQENMSVRVQRRRQDALRTLACCLATFLLSK